LVVPAADGNQGEGSVRKNDSVLCHQEELLLLSDAQRAILPDRQKPRLFYSAAPSGDALVVSPFLYLCCVGDIWVWSPLHFYFRGDLWGLWEQLVMFLVFSCLKPQKRVSSRRKKDFGGGR
jgi:hypothetical protein